MEEILTHNLPFTEVYLAVLVLIGFVYQFHDVAYNGGFDLDIFVRTR